MTIRRVALFASLLVLIVATTAMADKSLEGIACRSVHLRYPAPESVLFYNEVTVQQSAPGTYFMACGFANGYFGMQELADGKKVVLFSVWDPGSQNDPKSVEADRQVKVVAQGEGVRVKRFGGEGTGAQSMLDYDWKIGQTCRFLVKATVEGDRTAFSAWFFVPEQKTWHPLATFSTLAKGRALHGYYSFVEDFRRNRTSATQVRKADFGNGWIRTPKGDWLPLTRATFTGDSNPATNIDAGTENGNFFLATGGNTTNSHTPLNGTMERVPESLSDLPDEFATREE